MRYHYAFWFGVLLIGVALVTLPAGPIAESYVGGSAVHGHIDNGRFFVNPGHGQPIVEVSEATWDTLFWLERLWPFSALLPGLAGIALTAYGMGPSWKPVAMPPGDPPRWVMWEIMLSVGVTIAGTMLCGAFSRTPWLTMLVAYVLFCIAVGRVTWLWTRVLRRQASSELRDRSDAHEQAKTSDY